MKTRRTGVRSAENDKKWMRDNGLNYSAIASICKVSESTVRRWISQKGIPEKFSHCLKRLEHTQEKAVTFIKENKDGLQFNLSLNDHTKLSRKALESGCAVEELIARHINSLL